MGKIIKRGMLILMIILANVKSVKAEQMYLIILDDYKIKFDKSEGDFDDYTENTRYTITDSDSLVLQKIALAEAQYTDAETMAEIMLCVMNRVESEQFPNTISEVVKQKGQFSTYPKKYNKVVPNEKSQKALELIQTIPNRDQLYFENTIPGSWQSTNLEFMFRIGDLYFYK